eukprot:1009902-Prymnesium_polylepis.2
MSSEKDLVSGAASTMARGCVNGLFNIRTRQGGARIPSCQCARAGRVTWRQDHAPCSLITHH